jgi:GT2 family glycosyltransferase
MCDIIAGVAVVIATVGRKKIATETIDSLATRATLPEVLVVVGVSEEDLPEVNTSWPFKVIVEQSTIKSLTSQRNIGIKILPDHIHTVCFLDDDMEVHENYFLEVEATMRSKEIAGFSSVVLVNGNIERNNAREVLDNHVIDPKLPGFGFMRNKWPGFYGCAMTVRRSLLEIEKFDEKLPLYALGEDAEMGFRLSRHGFVGGSGRSPVVHLAAKSGRISEVGVGYAQIINIIYFANKRIGYPKSKAYWESLVKLPLINLVCLLVPKLEKRRNIDRRGRFIGNLYALRDVVIGRIDPMRLLKILSK